MKHFKGIYCLHILLACTLVFLGYGSTCKLHAQAAVPVAQLVDTNGDTSYYDLLLGCVAEPVANLGQLHFHVELVGSGDEIPPFVIDITEGFLSQDPNADYDVSEDSEGFEFYWDASTSAGVSGYGMIAKVTVVDGGIGIIDNIDAKANFPFGGSAAPTFRVGPNPVGSTLHVAWGEPFTGGLELWNDEGQVVLECKVQAESEIGMDVSCLKPGVYFLRSEGSKNARLHKVQIMR